MNCLYCGGELPEDAAFCPTCGSPIVGAEPQAADPRTAERRRKARMRHTRMIMGWVVGLGAAVAVVTTLGVIAYKKRKL